jgi:hypothetical protein
VRTPSLGRLVRAAINHLDAYDPRPTRSIRLDARLLVHEHQAVLVDPSLGPTTERVERRLERLGYRVADVAHVMIDEQRLEVVTHPPRFDMDKAALSALNREFPPETIEFSPRGSALPVRSFLLRSVDPERKPSPAVQLAALTRLAAPNARSITPSDLGVGGRLLAAWDVRACPSEDRGLLSVAREVADGS